MAIPRLRDLFYVSEYRSDRQAAIKVVTDDMVLYAIRKETIPKEVGSRYQDIRLFPFQRRKLFVSHD